MIGRIKGWLPLSMIGRIKGWLPLRVLAAYGESHASSYASALAFTCMLAMFPLILGVLSLIGLAIGDPAIEANAQALILQVFPASAQPQLLNAMNGIKHSAGWLGLLSLVGLLWSASSIFSTMEFALTQIFGTRQRDVVRQKLMGLVMMILLVVAVGVTVAANALAALFPLAWVTGFVIGSAVMVALLVILYRFVPNRTFGVRDVVPGALLAGVLIEVFSLGFPLYGRLAGGFNTYGAQFGLFFLLAAWFYIVSDLILFGAVYNKFRLGEPHVQGLVASPRRQSREVRPPVEVIEGARQADQQEAPTPAAEDGSQRRRGAAGYLVALGLLVISVFRRRSRTTTM
ncbi:MAG TPA: YihY/virulence factor BrkB family protein [Candidatus Dormibacteraeota bacterium]|nr:YihY/virulence factor BrkB family protein [Candidatus Dormibacteraeota bacterium]